MTKINLVSNDFLYSGLISILTDAGTLLLAGSDAASDTMYGFTSWGLSTNPSLICGSPGDINFFTNVEAFATFLAPYLARPVVAAPTAVAG